MSARISYAGHQQRRAAAGRRQGTRSGTEQRTLLQNEKKRTIITAQVELAPEKKLPISPLLLLGSHKYCYRQNARNPQAWRARNSLALIGDSQLHARGDGGVVVRRFSSPARGPSGPPCTEGKKERHDATKRTRTPPSRRVRRRHPDLFLLGVLSERLRQQLLDGQPGGQVGQQVRDALALGHGAVEPGHEDPPEENHLR